MKKLLTFGLILAAVLTLGLTSCINSPETLPGNWTNTTTFYQGSSTPFKVGTLTVTDQTVVYELKKPSEVEKASELEEGYYRSTCYYFTEATNFTGFKATVDSNANGGSGFIFCQSTNDTTWSYYYLYINAKGSIKVDQVINDVSTTIIDWTANAAIKPVGQKNEVLVYTDKTGTIQIKINGTQITEIKEPVLKTGRLGVICTLGYKDVQDENPIKVTYNFTDFQY